MRKMILLAGLGALALALASCGAAAGGAAQPSATAAPATKAPKPTDVPPDPGAPSPVPPSASGGGASVRPPDGLVQAAQQLLAAYLKLEPAALLLQSANIAEWPSSALGCPAPGQAYAQVLIDGFELIFVDITQQQYSVHTGESASQLILCQDSLPVDLLKEQAGQPGDTAVTEPAQLPAPGDTLLGLARAALAQELGLAEDAIALVSAEPAEWRDSSLGCPKPDMTYLQVITPGFRFVLSAQGQQYEYHTDMGQRVVRCDSAA